MILIIIIILMNLIILRILMVATILLIILYHLEKFTVMDKLIYVVFNDNIMCNQDLTIF